MLLLSYLLRVGAPFPPVDASVGLFLNIFVAVFIFMMSMLFIIVYVPIGVKYLAPEKFRILHPSFFEGRASERWNSSEFRTLYFLIYTPAYVSVVMFVIGAIMDLPSLAQSPGPRFMRDHTGPLVVIGAYVFTTMIVCAICVILNLVNGTKRYGVKIILNISLMGAASTLFWILTIGFFVARLFAPLGDMELPSMEQWAIDLLGVAILLLLVSSVMFVHYRYSMGSPRKGNAIASLLMCILFTTLIFPQGSVLAARTLYFLGVGGGVPVSIDVKTYAPSPAPSLRTLRGCLILGMGSTVTVRPFSEDEERALPKDMDHKELIKKANAMCELPSAPIFKEPEERMPPTAIEVYSRPDVVRLGMLAPKLTK